MPDLPASERGGVNEDHRGRTGMLLVALPPLVYTFMPRPPVPGSHLLVFPIMGAMLALFVLLFLSKRIKLHWDMVWLLILLAVTSGCMAVSFYVNAPELRTTAVTELVRPGLFGVFLLFGYFTAVCYGERSVRSGLVLAAKAILLGQLIIAATQLFDLPVFDFLFSTEKTSGLGSIMRITGSMTNPNIFAWIVAQASLIAFYYADRRRWLWLGLGAFLILVAGSRTLLLVFPFMLAFVGVWRRGGRWSQYLKAGALAGLATVAAVLLVVAASEYLPYLGELRRVAESGSLSAVRAVASRLEKWQAGYVEFVNGGVATWTIGLGSRTTTRVLDNDYMYVLVRLGALGLLLHAVFVGYTALLLRGGRRNIATVIGMQYLLFSLVLGLVYETLGGWLFPLLLLFFLGLASGIAVRDGRGHHSRTDALATRPMRA